MKRYNIEWGAHQEESEDGEWVLYEDVEAAIKAEREEIERLRDALNDIANMPETLPKDDAYEWYEQSQIIAVAALKKPEEGE